MQCLKNPINEVNARSKQMNLVVIADDLTGAAEIAGVGLRYGLELAFGINDLPDRNAQLTVIATNSRSETEIQAIKTHRLLTEKILESKPDALIFRKCDSVLRGHILAEFLTTMEIYAKNIALLEPANPSIKRMIRNGNYFIGENLIENTGFADDPDFPAHFSTVFSLLSKRCSFHSSAFTIRSDFETDFSNKSIIIPDCSNVDDMKSLLSCFDHHRMLIGGSSAFFEQFLKYLYPDLLIQRIRPFHLNNHFILVSGSTFPESRKIIKVLESTGCIILFFPPEFLLSEMNENKFQNWILSQIERLNHESRIFIGIADQPISFENSAIILKHRLTLAVQLILENFLPENLLIEGGATAFDILKQMNWLSLIPESELSQGVISFRLAKANIRIVIKPGSYSWSDNLF